MHRLTAPFTLALLLITCGLMVGAASAQPAGSGAVASEPQVISLRPQLAGESLEPAIQVIEQDAGHLVLEFELPALLSQELEVDGGKYQILEIAGGGFSGAEGQPMLPTFSRLIAIPDDAGVTWEEVEAETQELADYLPLPMQPETGTAFVVDRTAYSRQGYESTPRARIGEPALARGLRVVPITFQPVRCNPAGRTIEVASRIRARVTFGGHDPRNVLEHKPDRIAPSFDQLYRSLVVNYEGPRDGEVTGRGTYVLICPNTSSVISALQPLIEWRTRQGFEVHFVTTAQTGTSREAIKNWLQTAYNTWPNPPEFITLVGDVSGTVALPCWYETYSGLGGETDHPYVQLAGGDILADAHVGRISVSSPEQLQLYVYKITSYESTPFMTDTSWYTRGCVVGDPSHSGYTCIQIMQWLKTRLRATGYTEVDTIFTGPYESGMIQKVNRGDTVFSYRGYYNMSYFDTGDIENLTNGRRMPYAVNLTCDTGSFSGYSRSEAWIRAGTPPSSPNGGIASVGTATLGTDTRHNNCMTHGIWRGPFCDGLYHFGSSLTRGKYELYINYAQMDYNEMATFTCWNNLMGDAAGELWTAVPKAINVTYPATIAKGTNAVTVSVTQGGGPCADAYVCLWKDTATFIGGTTDAGGAVELPVNADTTGTMKITVTKHNHQAYLGTITVVEDDRFVGYDQHTIDDDASGTSSGNGDGVANPTEQIELPVRVKNFGTLTATGVTGTLSTDDPYVTILDAAESFGDIPGGGHAWCTDDFDIKISGGAPNGHVIYLGLDLHAGSENWHSLIEVPVVAAEFLYSAQTLYNVGTRLDPGESGQISVRIENQGGASGTSVTGTLVSETPWVTITDANGSFGTIGVGGTGENTSDRFGLSASADCFQGHIAPLTLLLQFSGGVVDTVSLAVTVGTADSNDPTGPDHYGYYALDNTDTGYSDAPTYAWVEIATNHGGSGTSVGLTDFGESQDNSKTVDLPFPFKYYGVTYTRATICSNGWMAMGSTYLTQYRNWIIPGADAPPNMIAPMWDNLYQTGDDKVYHKYESANHRYIVQWSRLRNDYGGSTENFEVILYDPAYHPTDTGDGIIIFQYETFNNSDYLQQYCSVGIQNATTDDGVLYGYYSYYNTGAATIATGRAIKFVTLSPQPRGTMAGTIVNETNGGTAVAGATVRLLPGDQSFTSGPDGGYGGAANAGVYTANVTHPSFATENVLGVWIVEGQTTTLNFALADIRGPSFSGTIDYGNTTDTSGPYEISATVTDYSAIEELTLLYKVNGSGWQSVALQDQGSGLYAGAIPGQAEGSLIQYYLYGRDVGDNVGTDPADAPAGLYHFWVLAPILSDDVEAGAGEWTHYAVTGGYVDQWHRSSELNHTSGGAWSWKFGDEGSGTYANLADGALVTQPIDLDGDATLTFWHWIESEVSQSYPGYAYDGGLLEVSVDGGAWTQITPVGGYPYRIRAGSQPGPFPAETPLYAGTQGWTAAEFDLTGITGSVQIRFRFGSDGATGLEGWYIDDIEIFGAGPGAEDAQEIAVLPTRVALHPNRPNPFEALRAETVIRFDLPAAANVRLSVLDVGGRLVRTLVDCPFEAGSHAVAWNGLDAHGNDAESGVYFYTLETGRQQISRRMLLLK